jgi:hypothetical protein
MLHLLNAQGRWSLPVKVNDGGKTPPLSLLTLL